MPKTVHDRVISKQLLVYVSNLEKPFSQEIPRLLVTRASRVLTNPLYFVSLSLLRQPLYTSF
jgi:hypothetical protein